MKPFAFIFIVIIGISMIVPACRKEITSDHVINDFESDADLDRIYWKCRTLFSLSDKYRTTDDSCLKMELYPDAYPGVSFKKIKKDWSKYCKLAFDIYNPSENKGNCHIVIRIDDQEKTPPYNDRYNQGFDLTPGMNHLQISLNSLITPNGRLLDLRHIHALMLFMVDPKEKQTLYLDHVHLGVNE